MRWCRSPVLSRAWLVLLTLFLGSFGAYGSGGPGVTYHGRLLKPNGQPVTSSSVLFKVQIRTAEPENCLMFEEIHTRNLSESAGIFSLTLGQAPTVLNTEPFSLDQVFRNRAQVNFPAGKCVSGGSFTLNPMASRQILVSFNDGSFPVGTWEPLPAQLINFVPTAFESVTVGGHGPENFFRVVDGTNPPDVLPPWTSASYEALLGLVGSVTTSSGTVTGISVPASGFTGSLSGDVTGTQGATSVIKIQGKDVSAANPSNGDVLSWDAGTSAWRPVSPATGGGGDVMSTRTLTAGTGLTGGGDLSADRTFAVNVGTGANQIPQLDGSGKLATSVLPSSVMSSGATAGGDLTGTYPNPTIAANAVTASKIVDGAVAPSKLSDGSADGQILRFDGTDWQITTLKYTDLSNGVSGGNPWPTASCVAGEVIVWDSVADGFRCQAFSLTGTVPISKGGTGATTAQAAINNLLPAQASQAGKILQTDGTNVSWVDTPSTGITALTGDVTGSGSGSVTTTLANNAVNSAKISDGSVGVSDLDFAGAMATNTGVVVRNGSQFFNKTCSGNETLVWSVANGWICGIPSVTETDPKVGTNTTNFLSKWDGSALVASAVFEDGGRVGIGTSTPDSSAVLDLASTSKGFLPPRMTSTQRNGLMAPASGLMVYDTSENKLYVYNGTKWAAASDSASGVFHYSRTGSVAIAGHGTPLRLTLNTKTVDADNVYNPATGVFTAPQDGFYQFSASVGWDSITTYAGLMIRIPSGASIAYSFNERSTGNLYLNASGGYYLTAGQQVEVVVWQWNGSNANVTLGVFSGFRVGAGSNGGSGGIADNMGNHTATQNVALGLNWLSGDGGNEGIQVDASGNVGIGTDAPSAKLHIAGTPGVDGIRFPDGSLQTSAAVSSGVNNTMLSSWPDAIQCTISNPAYGTRYLYLNTTGYQSKVWYIEPLAAGNGTYEGWITFNMDGSYNSSGAGYTAHNCNTSISSITSSGRTFNFAKGPAAQWLQSGANAHYNAGNVGIGTASPSQKLDVAGNINATGLCIAGDCRTSWPSGGPSGTIAIADGGTGATTAAAALNNLLPAQPGNSGRFLQSDGTNASWVSFTESDPQVGSNTLNYLSKWDGSALVASGLVESGGNIGIGTALPGEKLSVAGVIESTIGGIKFPDGTVQTTSATTGVSNSVLSGWPDVISCSGSGGNVSLRFAYQNSTYTGYVAGYSTGVDGDNLVLLFTTSTKTYSHASNTHGNFANLYTTCTGKSVAQLYAAGQAFNIAKGPVGQWLQSGSHAYYNTGNVGVGTSAPSNKLVIGSDIGATSTPNSSVAIGSATESAGLTLGQSNTARGTLFWNYNATASSASLALTTVNPVNHLVLQGTGGNVGIGTASPSASLHVSNAATTNNAVGVLESTGTNGRPYLGFRAAGSDYGWVGFGSTGNDVMAVMNYRNDRLILGTNSVARVTIAGTGEVGIGTATPTSTLHLSDSVPVVRLSSTNGSGNAAKSALEFYDNSGARTGYVGDGSSGNSSIYLLSESGSVIAVAGGGSCSYSGGASWSCSSDERLKEDVRPLENALDRILQLEGVSYHWKKGRDPASRNLGLIAQKVEKVFPQVVETDQETGFKRVDYAALVAPLIEAVREQQGRIDETRGLCRISEAQQASLQAMVQKHDREIASLKEENQELKSQIQNLKSYLCAKDPSAPLCP